MRRACVGLALLLVACATLAQVRQDHLSDGKAAGKQAQQRGQGDRLIQNAFQSAHTISLQLSPTDRVELLIGLARAARKKDPEKARLWAIEALQLTKEMRSSPQRSQYETDAIRDLASVSSEEALALLPGLDVLPLGNDCDARARAAASVFQEFLNQHPEGWERLSAVAQRMGDTGNFPFQAVQIVIGRIRGKDQETATVLMQQAIHYYSVSSCTPCTNHQLAILLTEDSSLVPASTLKAILGSMLSSLSNAAHSSPEDAAKPGTAGDGNAELSALNQEALVLLMTLIHSVDPEMERKFRDEHPGAYSDALDIGAAPESGFGIVDTKASADSADAPGNSSHGSAQASPTTRPSEESDDDDTAEIVNNSLLENAVPSPEESEEALKNERNPEQRLRILVERSMGLASSERWTELSNVLVEAFALGEKSFRKSVDDDPHASWRRCLGATELSTLVEVLAKSAPQMLLENIGNLRTSVLQAQLYVSFAEGRQSEEDPLSPVMIRAGDQGTQ
jgi:hypothetical protein